MDDPAFGKEFHDLVKKFFDEFAALGIAQTVFASRMGTIAGKFRMGGKDFARVAGHVQFGNDPDMVLCGKGDDLPDLLFRIESPVQSPLPRKFRNEMFETPELGPGVGVVGGNGAGQVRKNAADPQSGQTEDLFDLPESGIGDEAETAHARVDLEMAHGGAAEFLRRRFFTGVGGMTLPPTRPSCTPRPKT